MIVYLLLITIIQYLSANWFSIGPSGMRPKYNLPEGYQNNNNKLFVFDDLLKIFVEKSSKNFEKRISKSLLFSINIFSLKFLRF